MARWFYNRPSEHCDEHEIKVAKLLARRFLLDGVIHS